MQHGFRFGNESLTIGRCAEMTEALFQFRHFLNKSDGGLVFKIITVEQHNLGMLCKTINHWLHIRHARGYAAHMLVRYGHKKFFVFFEFEDFGSNTSPVIGVQMGTILRSQHWFFIRVAGFSLAFLTICSPKSNRCVHKNDFVFYYKWLN